MNQFVNAPTIDLLSVDVEGYDWDVLLGGDATLKRVNYLEFEYHQVGNWPNHQLSTAIDKLKGQGFVCYWAGAFGQLWRISDCWQEYYNLHYWSNVACVNVNQPSVETMAQRMEELFLQTLAQGDKIRYDHESKAVSIQKTKQSES